MLTTLSAACIISDGSPDHGAGPQGADDLAATGEDTSATTSQPGPADTSDAYCNGLAAALSATLTGVSAGELGPGGTIAAMNTTECGTWTGAQGEREPGVAMQPSALVRVGSVTKTYVAASLIKLAHDGVLSLDDPLLRFVATGVENEDIITIRQLLNHTAGVFNHTLDDSFITDALTNPDKLHDPQELIDVAIGHGADFEPGTSWEYSNTGYVLLGLVLEKLTATTASAHIGCTLFDPLGLDGTFLYGEEPLPEALAPGYGQSGQNATHAMHPSVHWTSGSMVARTEDLADWARHLYAGDVLDGAAVTQMLTFVEAKGLEYGLGVLRMPLSNGELAIGHRGSLPGYLTAMFYLPDHDVAIATVVTNSNRDPMHSLVALVDVVLSKQSPMH